MQNHVYIGFVNIFAYQKGFCYFGKDNFKKNHLCKTTVLIFL